MRLYSIRTCIASKTAAASGVSSKVRALVKLPSSRGKKRATLASSRRDVQMKDLERCAEMSVAHQALLTSVYRLALLPAAVVACLAAVHLLPPPRPASAAMPEPSSRTTESTSARDVSHSGSENHGQRTAPHKAGRAKQRELIGSRFQASHDAGPPSRHELVQTGGVQLLADLAATGGSLHGTGNNGTEESPTKDQQLAAEAYAKAVAAAAAGGAGAQPMSPVSQQSANNSGGGGGVSAAESPSILQMVMQQQESLASRVFRATRPSVVNISHSRSAQSFNSLDVTCLPQGQASGFIWDSRGHIVTCYHTVKGLAEVKVTLQDYSTFTAKIVGWDAAKDIAVLRLSIPKSRLRDLQPVTLGASRDLQIGQPIWGIGNPHGLQHTLSQGIVSGLGGEVPGSLFPVKGAVQTTASSAHQAGGVLVDAKGHVVGVLVGPSGSSSPGGGGGLGYALPMDTVKGLVDQVLLYGKPMRPSLGITFAPPQVLDQMGIEGVLVLEVPHGSPAALAGLRPTHRDIFGDIVIGDVVIGMEGRPVRGVSELYAVLDDRRAGDRVKVDIVRDNKATSLTLTLGERALGSAEE